MKKVNCLLIDDEPPAIQLLERYVSLVDHLEIVGTSHNAIDGFNLVNSFSVDLIFLDIQMPVMNGLDFIKTLQNPPAIILTTAYREYAVAGYDLDVIDYLLKPISFERFLKSVDRYMSRTSTPEAHDVVKSSLPAIHFKVNRTLHKVVLSDIIYVESLKDYVRIHYAENSLVVKGNIGSILKRLPGNQFLRIHRSFAVAINKVVSFNKSQINLHDISLPIGSTYKPIALEMLGNNDLLP